MDKPVFSEPWHAQLFAVTVHLSETGLFGWPEWTELFGRVLKEHGHEKSLDGGNDYFQAWLEALELMLESRNSAKASEIEQLVAAWRGAYLRTPHGEPVRL